MLGRLQTLCEYFTRSLMGRQERVFFPSGGLLLRRVPSRQTSPYDCCMGSIAIQSSEGKYRPRRNWRGKKGNWERLEEFGSSMEESEHTCVAGVGRGQIGVRVWVWERDGSGWGGGMTICWVGMREREPDGFGEESHTERSKCGERTWGQSWCSPELSPSIPLSSLTCTPSFLPFPPNMAITSKAPTLLCSRLLP